MEALPPWLSWKSNFACPACRGTLCVEENQIECQGCHEVYWIRDGIPYFTNSGNLNEFDKEESQFHSAIAEQADRAHGQATLRADYLHDGFLAPIMSLPPESVILDVACGTGIDIIRLATKGYRVIGVDISPGMILTAREKTQRLGLSDRVFLCVANARQLPFHDMRFPAVYICAALHHAQNPSAVLGELSRVTQPNGIVSIGSEPNAWIYRLRAVKHSSLGRRLMRLFRDDYTVGDQSPGDRETMGWTADDWPRILNGTGLELVTADPVWYLNGVASLLGLDSLPYWLEMLMCRVDRSMARAPLAKYYSVKWNVVAQKKESRNYSETF